MSPALSAPQSASVPQQQLLSDDWKQEITERLDRYRAHRPQTAAKPSSPPRDTSDSRATKIARAVASRYASAPTYSELIAAETSRAEALLAEQRAQQVEEANAAGNLFQDVDQEISAPSSPAYADAPGIDPADHELTQPTGPGTPVMPQFAERNREMRLHQAQPEPEPTLEDLLASALIEPRAMLPSKLIEFPRELISPRRARPHLPEDPTRTQTPAYPEESSAQLRIFEVQPEVEGQVESEFANAETSQPTTEQAARAQRKAIEEFVAGVQNSVSAAINAEMAEKAAADAGTFPARAAAKNESIQQTTLHRPVISAAPTRSMNVSASGTAKSKSTRASASAASTKPAASPNFRGLEWASISLDKEPAAYTRKSQPAASEYVPFMVDPASIDRRVMAFAVDFAAVTAGFLGFLVVFVASTPHLPTGLTAAALAGVVYLALWVLYQLLFFSLSGATAGMLYAHIALCTFDDQNPTRSALQRRLIAWWVSLLPLGIGFLWCFVDEDNLCWHDRITRTYQREY
ncbi:MAG: RDD family protein [Acidobacteriota bacterium]